MREKLRESVLTDGKIIYKVRYTDKIAFNMGYAQRGIAYKVDWNEIPDITEEKWLCYKIG